MAKMERFVALDLEFNQPSRTILQVGVCIGSRFQSEEEFTIRSWLLRTSEDVAPDIEALTGITDWDLVTKGVSPATMAEELSALLSDTPSLFVNPVTWGGGDAESLLGMLRSEGIRFPHFGRRHLDVKTMHHLVAFAGGKNPSGGLRSVMGAYKLPFLGKPHRAHVDAFNTLRLFFALLDRQETLETIGALSRGLC